MFTRTLSAAVVLLALVFAGCSTSTTDNPDTNGGNSLVTPSMKATIGSTTNYNTIGATASKISGNIVVTGNDGSRTISLTFPDTTKAGTSYTLSLGSTASASYLEGTTAYSTYTSLTGTGTITVTQIGTKSISGTFSFTASNLGNSESRVLTGGSFAANFQ